MINFIIIKAVLFLKDFKRIIFSIGFLSCSYVVVVCSFRFLKINKSIIYFGYTFIFYSERVLLNLIVKVSLKYLLIFNIIGLVSCVD